MDHHRCRSHFISIPLFYSMSNANQSHATLIPNHPFSYIQTKYSKTKSTNAMLLFFEMKKNMKISEALSCTGPRNLYSFVML